MLKFIRRIFARKPVTVDLSRITVAEWSGMSRAEQGAATRAHNAAAMAEFNARARAYSAKVAADNAAYKAAKPARVAAKVAELVKAGELDAMAARYGKTPEQAASAARSLATRFNFSI